MNTSHNLTFPLFEIIFSDIFERQIIHLSKLFSFSAKHLELIISK